MANQLRLSGEISNMGFKFVSSDEDSFFSNPLSTSITAVLEDYKTVKLCDYSQKTVDLPGLFDGGKSWSVTCPNKRIGKNIWAGLKTLNDVDRLQ